MVKVKIVKFYNKEIYCDHTTHSNWIGDGLTDWEEVTPQERGELQIGLFWLNKDIKEYQYVLVEQNDSTVNQTIANIRAAYKKHEADKAKSEAERQEKREERKKNKELDRKRKLLAEIKKNPKILEELKKESTK